MVREQRDELLADHAGRAEDADGNRCHNICLALRFTVPKKKADAVNRVGGFRLELV